MNCPKHPTEDLRLLPKKIFPQLEGDTYACPWKSGTELCDYRVLANGAVSAPVAAPAFVKKKKPSPVTEESNVLPFVLPEHVPGVEAVTGLKVVLPEPGDPYLEGLAKRPQSVAEREFSEAQKKPAKSPIETAMVAFIDGPIATVSNAFVALYLSSRNPTGDSKEAVAALDACRAAFDACGLLLVDVDTKHAPKEKLGAVSATPAEPVKLPTRVRAPKDGDKGKKPKAKAKKR